MDTTVCFILIIFFVPVALAVSFFFFYFIFTLIIFFVVVTLGISFFFVYLILIIFSRYRYSGHFFHLFYTCHIFHCLYSAVSFFRCCYSGRILFTPVLYCSYFSLTLLSRIFFFLFDTFRCLHIYFFVCSTSTILFIFSNPFAIDCVKYPSCLWKSRAQYIEL